jgi:hypothetical protein
MGGANAESLEKKYRGANDANLDTGWGVGEMLPKTTHSCDMQHLFGVSDDIL